jgi:hypothetical protein
MSLITVPERLEERMSQSAVLQDRSIDHRAAAEALADLRGLTLGARVTKRVHGVLRIDFDRDITVLADVAKPLFLETLGEAGAAIDEFADWDVNVSEKRISLEGDLTQDGLRRLFSFLEIDAMCGRHISKAVFQKSCHRCGGRICRNQSDYRTALVDLRIITGAAE